MPAGGHREELKPESEQPVGWGVRESWYKSCFGQGRGKRQVRGTHGLEGNGSMCTKSICWGKEGKGLSQSPTQQAGTCLELAKHPEVGGPGQA